MYWSWEDTPNWPDVGIDDYKVRKRTVHLWDLGLKLTAHRTRGD